MIEELPLMKTSQNYSLVLGRKRKWISCTKNIILYALYLYRSSIKGATELKKNIKLELEMIPYSKAKYFSEKIIFNKLLGIKHWSILGSKGMTPVTGFQMTEEKIIRVYIQKEHER